MVTKTKSKRRILTPARKRKLRKFGRAALRETGQFLKFGGRVIGRGGLAAGRAIVQRGAEIGQAAAAQTAREEELRQQQFAATPAKTRTVQAFDPTTGTFQNVILKQPKRSKKNITTRAIAVETQPAPVLDQPAGLNASQFNLLN